MVRPEPSKRIDERAVKVWRITGIFGPLLLGSLVAAYIILGFVFDFVIYRKVVIGAAIFILLLSLLTVLFIPYIRWKRWRYEVYKDEIDLQHGVFIIARTIIPMVRVQHVDTSQGPFLRYYGLAQVTIATAAGAHVIPALTKETADELRERISRLARVVEDDV